MALAARLVSRSRQLYSAQAAFVNGGASQVRSYAKEEAPADRTPVTGDSLLKDIFMDVKKKFEIVLGVFRTERIILDPDDPEAVAQYARVKQIAREKADLLNESQKLKYTMSTFTKGIPDARTYFNTLKELRVKIGIVDPIGIEAKLFEALDKVEKDIKMPLMRSDKKNMALLVAEIDKILLSFGVTDKDLPKLEEGMELDIAKGDLAELKDNAVEAMDAALKREEFKGEKMPDVRTLDVREFL